MIKECHDFDSDGNEYPNHKICQDEEMQSEQIERQFTTTRCYAEMGYKCAKAFFMPCNPNYDQNGNVIQGQEYSCPDNFKYEMSQKILLWI